MRVPTEQTRVHIAIRRLGRGLINQTLTRLDPPHPPPRLPKLNQTKNKSDLTYPLLRGEGKFKHNIELVQSSSPLRGGCLPAVLYLLAGRWGLF